MLLGNDVKAPPNFPSGYCRLGGVAVGLGWEQTSPYIRVFTIMTATSKKPQKINAVVVAVHVAATPVVLPLLEYVAAQTSPSTATGSTVCS